MALWLNVQPSLKMIVFLFSISWVPSLAVQEIDFPHVTMLDAPFGSAAKGTGLKAQGSRLHCGSWL